MKTTKRLFDTPEGESILPRLYAAEVEYNTNKAAIYTALAEKIRASTVVEYAEFAPRIDYWGTHIRVGVEGYFQHPSFIPGSGHYEELVKKATLEASNYESGAKCFLGYAEAARTKLAGYGANEKGSY